MKTDNASAGLAPASGSATCYANGQAPKRGDVIKYADPKAMHTEAREWWVVTSVCADMVRAKCQDAPAWRQAFYTAQMEPVDPQPNI